MVERPERVGEGPSPGGKATPSVPSANLPPKVRKNAGENKEKCDTPEMIFPQEKRYPRKRKCA